MTESIFASALIIGLVCGLSMLLANEARISYSLAREVFNARHAIRFDCPKCGAHRNSVCVDAHDYPQIACPEREAVARQQVPR
jgi:predicted RNA-binding Zn-ribbon protein involved in translation (DUF1610 family)